MEYKSNENIESLFLVDEVIETEDYLVRSLGKNDWEDMIEIYQNKYLHMYSKAEYLYNEKMAIDFFTHINYDFMTRKAITWILTRKEDNENLGVITLGNISNLDRKVEIGYVLKEKEMRKGIMSEVLGKIVENLLDVGFVRIEANVYKNNIASIRLCEKVGFENEGLRRKYLFNRDTGKFLDSYVFSIINKDE
ncbi:MAG: GNAT family N-acetyltransferase [Sarcina sp.]